MKKDKRRSRTKIEQKKIKKHFLILIVLMVINSYAQQSSIRDLITLTDSELAASIEKSEEQGYGLEKIIEKSKEEGATNTEISQFRKRISNLDDLEINSSRGDISGKLNTEAPKKLPIFGTSFFSNPNVNLIPSMNLATPEGYQLGPYDEILVEVWGAAAKTYQLAINRDGNVSITGVGPIYLNGLTIKAAKQRLKNSLSLIYSGLKSSLASEIVYLNLSLTKARSITINIIGQVKTPGTYTLNGFSTPMNALYACGGIGDLGSFRRIELIRNGKIAKLIDLYDYLSRGIAPKTILRDQDIIRVPFYKTRVQVKGAFKQNGVFELLEREHFSDILEFNGGFEANAFKEEVTVDRVSGAGKTLITLHQNEFDQTALQNGDVLTAKTIGEDYDNRVVIEGAINIAGAYELSEVPSVGQLLEKAGGPKDNALKTAALLYRKMDGIETEIISIDLTTSREKLKQIALAPNDRLLLLRKNNVSDKNKVSVEGEVKKPGIFEYFRNMTLRDALILAGGIKATASLENISVYETEPNDLGEYNYILKHNITMGSDLKLSNKNNVVLSPRSVVMVKLNPSVKEIQYASISGEVKNPGKYLIRDEQYKVSDLIKESNGMTSKASKMGVYVLRSIATDSNRIINDTLSIDQQRTQLRIPIEFDPITNLIPANLDIPLQKDDQVIVESLKKIINVKGAVLQETAAGFNPNERLKNYIHTAGGFGVRAKKTKVYVINQNGKIFATKNFLGIRFHPKLSPGATIYVPQKMPRNKISFQEIFGLTSAVTTFGLLIRNYIN